MLHAKLSMLRENWTIFSIVVNKYFLPRESNFYVRLKAVSHFISQNLEAINRPDPKVKNNNKYTWILF